MTDGVAVSARAREELGFSRWWQLVAAVVVMGLVSPYKYVWSSVQAPLAGRLDVSIAALGTAFTLYVVFISIIQFPAGVYRDRYGPRALTALAAVLSGTSYVGLGYATTVWQVYVVYSLGAIGVGIAYTVATNTALKWFPDRRGLTTGVGTMAFAAGSVVFVPYVRANTTAAVFPPALRNIGVLILVGVAAGALVLRDPPDGWLDADTHPASDTRTAEPSHTWRETVRTRQFWLLAGVFAAITGASFALTANLVPFAEHAAVPAGIATAAATVLPLADGFGRLSIGAVSDRLGRERSMLLAFSLCGVGVLAVTLTGARGWEAGFLAAVALAAFFQGTQYTLAPSLVADYYGSAHSSANYAAVYTMELVGGVFGGAGVAVLVTAFGWRTAFFAAGILGLLAALGTFFLHPPR